MSLRIPGEADEPQLSPDAKHLLFSVTEPADGGRQTTFYKLWLADVDGGASPHSLAIPFRTQFLRLGLLMENTSRSLLKMRRKTEAPRDCKFLSLRSRIPKSPGLRRNLEGSNGISGRLTGGKLLTFARSAD